MSSERADGAALTEPNAGGKRPARYHAFFTCFNRQLFFEAHEVLEKLWLAERGGPEADFFQGLIQLAAAFVHLQKGRPGPAAALLRRAQARLHRFSGVHWDLDTSQVRSLISEWSGKMEAGIFNVTSWAREAPPELILQRDVRPGDLAD